VKYRILLLTREVDVRLGYFTVLDLGKRLGRYIEKITVYDEKVVVEFKSGLTVGVEA
jgi:hypothetical protein